MKNQIELLEFGNCDILNVKKCHFCWQHTAAIQEISDAGDIRSYIRQAQRYTVNVRGNQMKKLDGLIQPISDKIPDLYMVTAPGAYNNDYGIAPEWETLIF